MADYAHVVSVVIDSVIRAVCVCVLLLPVHLCFGYLYSISNVCSVCTGGVGQRNSAIRGGGTNKVQ